MSISIRKIIPHLITFTSLSCAFSAILLAIDHHLTLAGLLILVGYIADAVDGALARRMGIAGDFGKHLDSIVDVVNFGVAPAVLMSQHLREPPLSPMLVWLGGLLFLLGGAFRLARFNLLPHKKSHSESIGLTISTAGAILTLSVMSDQVYEHHLLPEAAFPIIAVVLSLLMISRIRFPPLAALFSNRLLAVGGLSAGALLAIWLTPQFVGLCMTGGYVSFGLIRALYWLIWRGG
nr:hypothetical protein [Anaerolineae bacterium]